MQITLSTFGTLGDLLPYLALGRALQARGHKVLMAIPEGLLGYAERAKLQAVPCYPHEGAKQVKAFAEGFDHWPTDLHNILEDEAQITARAEAEQGLWKKVFDVTTRIRDLAAACNGADLLVCHSLISGEPIAAEIARVPCIHAEVAPERLWLRLYQNFLRELEGECPAMSPLARLYFERVQTLRQQSGLPETPPSGWRGYFRTLPTLLAASPRFLEPIDSTGWNAEICGFWFYDEHSDSCWEPDPELAAFVKRAPAPIVLTFSSLPLKEPDRVLALHVEAARQIGRPLVVLAGWSGMAENANIRQARDVLVRDFVPGDWLFARVAAVIHHGGIGTIARALRNGCPMLVEPWGNDQFFNAMLVLKNGAGAAANPKKLSSGEVARLLATKVLSKQAREQVQALAEEIRREDGIRHAVRVIEQL